MQRKLLIYMFGVVILLGFAGAVAVWHFGANRPTVESPYVAQLASPVRGLSAQEMDDLLNGRGAGYARMAELNSYPGPRHVLDLRQELDLSPAQLEQINAVFAQMEAEAKQLGQEIVQRETALSEAFARQTVTVEMLQVRTGELAQLYGRLRATHLQAHLQITPLLSPEQIHQYNLRRGYSQPMEPAMSGEHRHHGE